MTQVQNGTRIETKPSKKRSSKNKSTQYIQVRVKFKQKVQEIQLLNFYHHHHHPLVSQYTYSAMLLITCLSFLFIQKEKANCRPLHFSMLPPSRWTTYTDTQIRTAEMRACLCDTFTKRFLIPFCLFQDSLSKNVCTYAYNIISFCADQWTYTYDHYFTGKVRR